MKKYLFFDLDGTLTDSAPGIINSILYAFHQLGFSLPPRQSLSHFIGPPLHESFQNYLHCSLKEAEEAVRLYRIYFRERGLFENSVYPGVLEMLDDLKKQGFFLSVATSKPEEYAIRILKHFQLFSYFSNITGSTMDGSISKKEDVLTVAIQRIGRPASTECIMIGDRKHDVYGAKHCGLNCLGVLYGYGTQEELICAGARWVASSPQEVVRLLQSI